MFYASARFHRQNIFTWQLQFEGNYSSTLNLHSVMSIVIAGQLAASAAALPHLMLSNDGNFMNFENILFLNVRITFHENNLLNCIRVKQRALFADNQQC